MPKKPSFDSKKMKEFFLRKGERLGLWTAVGISLLLVVTSLPKSQAPAGSPTWQTAFASTAANTKQQIENPGNIPPKTDVITSQPKPPTIPRPGNSAPFSEYTFQVDNARRMPN